MLLRPLLSASMLQKLINCMGFELQYKCTLTYWSQCNCPQLLLPVNNECLSLQTCIYKVLLIEELLAVAITVTKYNIVTAPAETKIKHSMLAKCKFDFLYKLYLERNVCQQKRTYFLTCLFSEEFLESLFCFFLCFINILFLLHSGNSWSLTDIHSTVKITQQVRPYKLDLFQCTSALKSPCCTVTLLLWPGFFVLEECTDISFMKTLTNNHIPKSQLIYPFSPWPIIWPLRPAIFIFPLFTIVCNSWSFNHFKINTCILNACLRTFTPKSSHAQTFFKT